MQAILLNMANILLLQFVREHNIDIGTDGCYPVKKGRGFTYALRDGATGQREFCTVTFHRSQVPTYSLDNNTLT